jgi:hypothetical protein
MSGVPLRHEWPLPVKGFGYRPRQQAARVSEAKCGTLIEPTRPPPPDVALMSDVKRWRRNMPSSVRTALEVVDVMIVQR